MQSHCRAFMCSVRALELAPLSGGVLLALALVCSAARADLIDYSDGFPANPPDLIPNGDAHFGASYVRLTTDFGVEQVGSVFSDFRCNITSFDTTFTFHLFGGQLPHAEGITFTIQGDSPTALGSAGGGLGYGPPHPDGPPGIAPSVAIKFDLWDNAGEGINTTGLFTGGHSPTIAPPSPDIVPNPPISRSV